MKKLMSIFLAAALMCSAAAVFAEEAPASLPQQTETAEKAESAENTENALSFATVGQALEKADVTWSSFWDAEHCILVIQSGERIIRVVADLDRDTGDKLLAIAFSDMDPDAKAAREKELIAALPVSSAEDITASPKTQAELDAAVGKTIRELENEGYEIQSYGYGGENNEVSFEMASGIFVYQFVVNETAENFEKLAETEDFSGLTVKSASFTGMVSSGAAESGYIADEALPDPSALPAPEEDDPVSAFLRELSGILDGASENGEDTPAITGEKIERLMESLGAALAEVKEKGAQAIQDGEKQLSELLQNLPGSLTEFWETIRARLQVLLNTLSEQLTESRLNAEQQFDTFMQRVRDAAPELKKDFESILDTLAGLFR